MLDNKSNDSKSNEFLDHLLHLSYNKRCADCSKPNPSWASTNLAFFICYECSAIHRSLGTEKSKVKSIQLDSWSQEELRRMYVGGNKNTHKLLNNENTNISMKYKDISNFVKTIDQLVIENKKEEPGDSFMNFKKEKENMLGKVKIKKQQKQKFTDIVSSSEEEIPTKSNEEIQTKKNGNFIAAKEIKGEETSSDCNFERSEKSTVNLKKSINTSRSPFSFTVKEIEENEE